MVRQLRVEPVANRGNQFRVASAIEQFGGPASVPELPGMAEAMTARIADPDFCGILLPEQDLQQAILLMRLDLPIVQPAARDARFAVHHIRRR